MNSEVKTGTILDALLVARLIRPYYAAIISSLTPVESRKLETYAVDSSLRLYYNPERLAADGPQVAGRIIALHEVEHILRRHSERCCGRVHQQWNIAGDLEINDDTEPGELPANALFPGDAGLPSNETAEFYYDNAHKTPEKKTCDGGSGAGNPRDFELEPLPHMKPEDVEILREMVAEDILNHEKALGPGSVPKHAVVWANETKRVKVASVAWRIRLTRAIKEMRRGVDAASWSKLPRRASTIITPGYVRTRPKLSLIVDTSGSMFEIGPVVLSYVDALLGSENFETIFSVDTAAHRVRRGSKLEFVGGGGTDVRVAFEAAARFKPSAYVLITDGETPWPPAEVLAKTLVILISDSIKSVDGAAQVINISPKKE